VRVDRALGARTRADRAVFARLLFIGGRQARRAARFLVAGVLATTGLLLGILPMTAAHADSGSSLVALTNQARAAQGLAPLANTVVLAAVAQAQANRMAAANVLAHNPDLSTDVCCWAGLGENVGYGGSTAILDSAFLASPDHRANIMGHYNQIGIGVAVDSRGLVWVSEVFRLSAGASTNTVVITAPAAPKPTSKPAAARPVQVRVPTRSVVVRPVITPKPSAVPGAAPTIAVAPLPARTVPQAASRSLSTGRLPIAEARQWATRWAAMLLSPAAASDSADPVASVLSFAAQTASAAGSGAS
jgi:hypothetical protein